MKLALQLSCYNGGRYLPFVFESLKKQHLTDWHLYVLDNASDEENKQLIAQAVKEAKLPITLDRVETNIGFAGAHNYLFKKYTKHATYIQLLNDDAFLEPMFLSECLTYLEKHPECAASSGVVYRWDFDARTNDRGGRTRIIDTLGLDAAITGGISDRGAGQDAQTLDIPEVPYEVFGVSGCLPMYRVQAVRAASPDMSLFDETYVLYKEDVDLTYRLRALGYTATIVPSALAYHRRTLGRGAVGASLWRPQNEKNYLSYRNHLWTLMKSLPAAALCKNHIAVLPYESAKMLYWTLHNPLIIWRTWQETRAHWSHLREWRKHISLARRSPKPFFDRPEKPKTDIAIILVSHDDLSEKCLTSLQQARAKTTCTTTVVVVDNQSSHYDANAFVEQYIPDAWTLLRDGDHGYGRSMNRGAAHVDAKYYFILNPDTMLADEDIFNKLTSYMEKHPDVGLIGPKVEGFSGDLHETCRRFPAWFQPFIQRTALKNTSLGKKYLHTFLMQDYDHQTEKAVDWVQGSAMFVEGNLWKMLRGFDDRFWLYFEDVDLCRRVWESGKKVIYLPSVTILHQHGRQSAKIHNILVNLITTKESRGHIFSWIKYTCKWLGKTLPRHE